jgi:hypothetical protein
VREEKLFHSYTYILYYTILYYTILYYTILYYTILTHIAIFSSVICSREYKITSKCEASGGGTSLASTHSTSTASSPSLRCSYPDLQNFITSLVLGVYPHLTPKVLGMKRCLQKGAYPSTSGAVRASNAWFTASSKSSGLNLSCVPV